VKGEGTSPFTFKEVRTLPTGIFVWYWISSLFLAILLFRPAKKFIVVQKVRKAERNIKRQLTEEETAEIERKTIPVTVFIVLTFSLLFNRILMGKYFL
jgi:hypothetical protein